MNVHFPAQRRWASRLAHLAVVIVVLALAAATFVLSYTGVHSIALQAGVPARLARIYPGIFDAALVIACAAALMLREGRWWARAYAWLSIILVIAVVGAADAVHAMNVALPHRKTAGVVAAVPWVLVLLGFSLWMTMLRQSRTQHADQSLQPTALEPTALEPDALEPDALEPDARRPVALEPTAPQSAILQPTAPQPTAPQPTVPQSTAPESPRPEATPAEPAAALLIPEGTSGDEETPVSWETVAPEETAALQETAIPEETAPLEETAIPEGTAATEASAEHEPAPSAGTLAEEAAQMPEPVSEAQGETSSDEGQPLSQQATAESETADGRGALPHDDYWDTGNTGEPDPQPATAAPPAMRRRRVPAAPDEQEEPPPPFATVPRLRRVRSTPTPPADDDEEQ